MDYKALLKKYMRHVGECEGVDFVSAIGSDPRSDLKFSADELQELRTMSDPERDWTELDRERQ